LTREMTSEKGTTIREVAFRTVELSDPQFEHEGLRTVTVQSPALGHRADVSVWVPSAASQASIHTLLILLHGVYGSHWVWPLKAGVHRTAQRMLSAGEIGPMIIAAPSDGLALDGSAYLAHPHAEDAERWILDEVPAIAQLAAPHLDAAAKIAIAGLSMGGYGALRLGAKYPERFAAISAHSAITEIEDMQRFTDEPLGEYLRCAQLGELRPFFWLHKNRGNLPPLRFDCGIDDPLIEGNRTLHAALESEGIGHCYEEFPGGHEWPYWQTHVESTLRFVDTATRSK